MTDQRKAIGVVLTSVGALLLYFEASFSPEVQVMAAVMLGVGLLFLSLWGKPVEPKKGRALSGFSNWPAPTPSKTVIAILGLSLSAAAAAVMSFSLYNEVKLLIAEQIWQPAQATIVSSRIIKRNGNHSVTYWDTDVVYFFSVAGRSYLARDDGVTDTVLKVAEQRAATLSAGAHAVAYYDPLDAHRSVLFRKDPNGRERRLLRLSVVLFFAFAGSLAYGSKHALLIFRKQALRDTDHEY